MLTCKLYAYSSCKSSRLEHKLVTANIKKNNLLLRTLRTLFIYISVWLLYIAYKHILDAVVSGVLLHQSNKSCLLYCCVAFCPPGIFLRKAQRAVQRVWRPTRPTSLWRENLSASWEAPSITSVSPESTGRTVCWRWKPVALTLSRRRLPRQQTAASPWSTFRLKN